MALQIEDPVAQLSDALEKKGIEKDRFKTLRPGESWDIPAASEATSDTPKQAASGNL